MKPRRLRPTFVLLAALLFLAITAGSCPEPEVLRIYDGPLRIAEVGTDWRADIGASGGARPYWFTVEASDLPSWLAFERLPDASRARISGTPQEAGLYTFTMTVSDARHYTDEATFSILVVERVDLTGTWAYTMTVTSVRGDCGEQVGAQHTHTLTITQTDRDLVFSGFFGDPQAQLTGELTLDAAAWDATVAGSYPEDGGTTTGTHELRIYTLANMEGTESWSWAGPGSACTDSKARITAARTGP